MPQEAQVTYLRWPIPMLPKPNHKTSLSCRKEEEGTSASTFHLQVCFGLLPSLFLLLMHQLLLSSFLLPHLLLSSSILSHLLLSLFLSSFLFLFLFF